MRGFIGFAGCLVLGCGVLFSQELDLKFEVASVRPTKVPLNGARILKMNGGPGTADPERISYSDMPFKPILVQAYGVPDDRIVGPGWLDSERYDIVAKVPPGATKEQLNGMLRNLLAERFHLTLHHEARVMAVYELKVGKGGPKLKEADANIPPSPVREAGSRPPTIGADRDGFLQIPPGRPVAMSRTTNGIVHTTFKMTSLSDLAKFLGIDLGRPVLDKTGLAGQYDFTLAYSRDGLTPSGRAGAPGPTPGDDTPSGGPDLFRAVQDQLGLKLDSAKDPIDFIVIDHMEKVPTEN